MPYTEPATSAVGLFILAIPIGVSIVSFVYYLLVKGAREDKIRFDIWRKKQPRMYVVKDEDPESAQVRENKPKWKLVEKGQAN